MCGSVLYSVVSLGKMFVSSVHLMWFVGVLLCCLEGDVVWGLQWIVLCEGGEVCLYLQGALMLCLFVLKL